MISLTDSQRKAIEFVGNTAIIAAAGSGKTFTIVEKIATLIQNGTPLSRFFISTFTKKAGEEIRRRLQKRLNLAAQESRHLKADTLHGLASEILRSHVHELGLPENFNILEGPLSKIDLLKLIRTRLLKWAEEGDKESIDIIERYDFHKAVQLLLELLLSQNFHDHNCEYAALLEKLSREFSHKKRSQGFLDFQDLEQELLILLQNPVFQKKLQKSYQWIIIDEFQDTSPIQWEIISKLWSSENHLMIVGDPRQSIYRFRGANPHLFSKVTELIENRQGKIHYLNENFRSGPRIIDFVNHLSHDLFSPELPDMVCASHEETDQVECHLLESGKIAEMRHQEALWVADKIESLRNSGWEWDQMALLFRTRKAIPSFTEILTSKNIPYVTNDEKTLLEQDEYLQVVFLLKRLLHPDDSFLQEAFQYTYVSPLVWEELKTDFDRSELKDFLVVFFQKISPSFLEKSSIYLQAIQKLLEDLILLGSNTLNDLILHLEILKEEKALIPSPVPNAQANAVQLMTVHASKGLEFDAVFLCDLSGRKTSSQRLFLKDKDGKIHFRDFDENESLGLQHKLSKSLDFEKIELDEKEEEQQESHRLLYVALTRAIRYLGMALPPPPKNKKSGAKNGKDWKDYLNENFGN